MTLNDVINENAPTHTHPFGYAPLCVMHNHLSIQYIHT